MQAEKKLVNEVNTVEMLYDITMVYEEIYANRMRAIRESVLRNRYFLENLHTVFGLLDILVYLVLCVFLLLIFQSIIYYY